MSPASLEKKGSGLKLKTVLIRSVILNDRLVICLNSLGCNLFDIKRRDFYYIISILKNHYESK